MVRNRCVDLHGSATDPYYDADYGNESGPKSAQAVKQPRTSNGMLTVTQTCAVKNQTHVVLSLICGISVNTKTADSQKAGKTGSVKILSERKLLGTPQLRRFEILDDGRSQTFRT